jgi:hypothetical protein
MSSQNPLGRTFNATANVTSGTKRASLRDCAGIGFLVVNASAATTITIAEANAASGGTSQTLAGTFPYWTQAATGGVWIAGVGGVNGTSITTVANTAALLYVYIPQGALSDGFSYLNCTHATGTSIYLLGDLDVQRKVTNLRDVTA